MQAHFLASIQLPCSQHGRQTLAPGTLIVVTFCFNYQQEWLLWSDQAETSSTTDDVVGNSGQLFVRTDRHMTPDNEVRKSFGYFFQHGIDQILANPGFRSAIAIVFQHPVQISDQWSWHRKQNGLYPLSVDKGQRESPSNLSK